MRGPIPAATAARRRLILALVAVALLLVAAAGVWYLFFRPAGPAPVSLGGTAATSTAAASVGAPTDVTGSGSPTAPSASSGTAAGSSDVAGTWTVDPSVGSFSDFSGSFVGYRVREELASVGATEAVGRTPDVTGSLTIDGTTVTQASFQADLTTLQSDERNRDRQLSRQALETGTYPTASFTLTQPIDLGSVPPAGTAIDVTATGDLTLHGTTRSVQIPLQAKLDDGVMTVIGSLPITFADYGIEKPQAMIVLSVEDNGTMELQLQLRKS